MNCEFRGGGGEGRKSTATLRQPQALEFWLAYMLESWQVCLTEDGAVPG